MPASASASARTISTRAPPPFWPSVRRSSRVIDDDVGIAMQVADSPIENPRARRRGWLRRALTCMVGALALGMAGCASLPPPVKAEAFAIPAMRSDQLTQVAASGLSPEGTSSFRPMPFSRVSMDTRLALAKHAQHSLDLQYYLLQNDYTGRTLLRA